MTMTAVYSE